MAFVQGEVKVKAAFFSRRTILAASVAGGVPHPIEQSAWQTRSATRLPQRGETGFSGRRRSLGGVLSLIPKGKRTEQEVTEAAENQQLREMLIKNWENERKPRIARIFTDERLSLASLHPREFVACPPKARSSVD